MNVTSYNKNDILSTNSTTIEVGVERKAYSDIANNISSSESRESSKSYNTLHCITPQNWEWLWRAIDILGFHNSWSSVDNICTQQELPAVWDRIPCWSSTI